MKPYLALIAALGLAACVNESTDTGSDPQPGQIQLVQGLSKSSSSSDSSTNYVFNLDTIKGSVTDEFILQNTGDFDVKNIKLTTNNPHFYFSPSEISILRSSKKSLLVQVIKLNIVHGFRLDGVGTDSLLPMGNNTVTATLKAVTTNSHSDSISLSQIANLKVFAKVMDINAFSDSTSIDLSHSGTVTGTPFPFGVASVYTSPGKCKLLNTGNVDITIREWNKGQTAVLDSAIIKPGDSFFPTVNIGNTVNISVELDAQGVIANSSKFRRTTDGKIFFIFYKSFP